MGKRRNIRNTARATRKTAKSTRKTAANTAQANALLRQQTAADTAARQHEHEFRYATDPKYRAFSEARAKYEAEMAVYGRQVKRARRRAALGTVAAISIVLALGAAALLLLVSVWAVQRVQGARSHAAVDYWQRAPLEAAGRWALGLRHVDVPAAPQLTRHAA